MKIPTFPPHPGKFKHVAMVFKKGRLLAIGFNQFKTHPKAHGTRFNTLHAELAAILKVRKHSPKDLVMYVVRVRKQGTLGLSKPCEGCQAALEEVGFKKVFYSTNAGGFERL